MQTFSADGRPLQSTQIDRRARFIVKTYNTLFTAILAFAGIEYALFASGLAPVIAQFFMGNWLLVLGGFMVIGWFGSRVAHTSESNTAAIAALSAYVVAEAIIFVPMLYIAEMTAPGAIQAAGITTIAGFAGLSFVAHYSKRDFSFLGSALRFAGIMVLVLIGLSFFTGLQLGTWFSVGMVLFAGLSILHDTSNILRHYPEDRHVAAALSLFASVALMFWYVLRLFMSRD